MTRNKWFFVVVVWLFSYLVILLGFGGCSHAPLKVTPEFLGDTVIHSYERGKEVGAEEILELFKDLAEQAEKETQYEKDWY